MECQQVLRLVSDFHVITETFAPRRQPGREAVPHTITMSKWEKTARKKGVNENEKAEQAEKQKGKEKGEGAEKEKGT